MSDNVKEIIDELESMFEISELEEQVNNINKIKNYITNLQEREKELIIQSNALSHYLIKQGLSWKDIVKIVDDFKL